MTAVGVGTSTMSPGCARAIAAMAAAWSAGFAQYKPRQMPSVPLAMPRDGLMLSLMMHGAQRTK
jgi:hypothetical protein